MKKMDMDKKKITEAEEKYRRFSGGLSGRVGRSDSGMRHRPGRFSDAKSHWASASLEKAVEEGVLNGSDGKLIRTAR